MKSGEEPQEVQLMFGGDTETLLVTSVGPNLYRMEESSILGEVSYRDVIEAEPQPDGTVRFLRILTPSGLTTLSWILPHDQIESPGLKLLLEGVMAVGGNWERIFGGVLIVHLPPAHSQQMTDEFNRFFDQFRNDAPVQRNA